MISLDRRIIKLIHADEESSSNGRPIETASHRENFPSGRGGSHRPGHVARFDVHPRSFARTTAYVLYAIVFRETSVGRTRARTLFALRPSPVLQCPPSFSSRNSTGVTLHLAPVSRTVASYPLRPNSRRYRLPLPPPFASILSEPPSFYSLRVRSRVKKNARNGRHAVRSSSSTMLRRENVSRAMMMLDDGKREETNRVALFLQKIDRRRTNTRTRKINPGPDSNYDTS